MSRVRYILLVVMLLIAASACQRRPLVEEDLSVHLKLNIDYDIPHYAGAKSTQHMRASFYDIQTEELLHVDITGNEGGIIHIPAGDYKMLIYNTGTEITQVRNREIFSAAEAYTNEISRFLLSSLMNYLSTRQELLSLKGVSTDTTANTPDVGDEESRLDENIVYAPNHLFVARNEAVHIPIRILGNEPVTIEATAQSVVESWHLEVRSITGIENVGKVTALITGMVGSNFIAGNLPSDESVTIYEEMNIDAETNSFSTIFNTFGKQPSERNILSVVITDTGNGQYQYNFDISNQFINNPERKIVVTTDINVPKPEYGGGGFKPSIDNWDEEHTDIEI